MIDPLSFALGWAGALIVVALAENIPHLIEWRRAQAEADAERAASLTDMVCPWPLRQDELAARPDWAERFTAASSKRGGGQQADIGTKSHGHSSSRFSVGGSESHL